MLQSAGRRCSALLKRTDEGAGEMREGAGSGIPSRWATGWARRTMLQAQASLEAGSASSACESHGSAPGPAHLPGPARLARTRNTCLSVLDAELRALAEGVGAEASCSGLQQAIVFTHPNQSLATMWQLGLSSARSKPARSSTAPEGPRIRALRRSILLYAGVDLIPVGRDYRAYAAWKCSSGKSLGV